MILRLSEIDNDIMMSGETDGARLIEGKECDFRFLTPVKYHLTVRKLKRGLRISGSIDCTLMLSCSRCLEEFPFVVTAEMDIELEPKDLLPGAHEMELRKEDMDVEYFEKDEIDLEPLIYEEILLSIPMMPLCRDECGGICEVCGKNRNTEECTCERPSGTLLGEKLKKLLQ